ncbi:bacteriophage-like membrane protein [Mycobacteroides abscessus subsp. abscessus]|nr:bacteriophage-like membrane protein [Mycobacteroides abscessus subsp. abscessus]
MANDVNAQIYVQINARSLNKATADILKWSRGVGTTAGKEFGDAFSRAAKIKPDLPSVARFAADGRAAGEAYSRGFASGADRGLTSVSDAAQTAAKNLQNVSTAATGAGSSIASSLNPVAIAAGAAALTAAATAVIGAIGLLGGSVAELTPVIGALPGLLSGVAAGFATAKIATLGFSDAISDIRDAKKFAQDLQELSPNAQQAALAIQAMLPAFDQLKNAAQDALFANVGRELNQLASTYLPSIQAMTTSISTSFNKMFKSVADALMTPETQAAIQSAIGNIGQAFQNLVPAIGPVTNAIAQLVNVSSSFLPGMATAVANVAQQFSAWLSEAARTGELRLWIQQALDALGQIGSLLPTLRDMFIQFKANGQTAMHDLVEATRGVIWIVGELGGAYDRVSGVVKSLANLTVASFNLIGSSISASLAPLRELVKLNNKINPLFNLPVPGEFTPANLPSPGSGINPFNPGIPGRAVPELNSGAPATPGLGSVAGTPLLPSNIPAYPNTPYPVPAVPATGGGGSKATHGPTVPYAGDPMSLLQGYQPTAALYGAAGAVLDDRQRVAQLHSDLNKLESANVRDEDAIVAKRNELAKAEREQTEAELRLNEAKASATKKLQTGMADASKAFGDIGANLDKDLGFSKGLPGLADNLVRFLASLATAPLMGQLSQVAKQGDGSYGLFGMALGGPSQSVAGQQVAYPGQGMAGFSPAFAARPGQSARDFAHQTMMPYWQSQGLTVGDHQADQYGEHQNGALDIMVPNIARGNQVLSQVLSDPNVYGAIFNNQTYGYGHGPTPQPYGSTGGPTDRHEDHVHAWYKPGGGNNIVPQGFPSLAGGPLSAGMPQGMPMGPSLGLVSPGYSAQATPQAQGGWQPNGGGGIGVGGLAGGAIQAAIAAAGTAGAPFGGQAAAAAAQMGMQLLNRTIAYGGQVTGIAAEGLIDSLTPTNPDTGQNPLKDSWLWRVAGALAGARPAVGSGGAGDQDKAAQKRMQEEQARQAGDTNHTYNAPQNMTQNINVMQGANQSGKSVGQDAAQQLQQAVMLPR